MELKSPAGPRGVMNDPDLLPTSGAAPVPPAPTGAEPPTPCPRRRAGLLGRCAAVLAYPIRWAWRTAVAAVLLALIVLAVGLIGGFAWEEYHGRAARSAVDHYHNAAAREHLQACLWLWPRNADALLLAARTARRTGAFAEAEQFLDRYEKLRGKDDGGLLLERVLLQAHRGRVDRVREFCDARVRQNHPDADLVLEAQTAGLMRVFRLAEAEDRLRVWLERRPDDCEALLFQGILYDMQNRTNDAVARYRRVVELDPDNDDARMRLSALLIAKHEASDALTHLEYLQKLRPDDVRVPVRIAQCREEMGQPGEAEKILDGVLARQPHQPEALALRGNLAMQDGQLEEAETWLREATARDPGAYEARYHLYLCLARRGKTAESEEEHGRLNVLTEDLKDIQEIVGGKMQQAPDDPALHYKAGMITLRMGSGEDGVRWLESALELDPHYAPAHRALALYYQGNGDPGRAAHHRALAQAADPDGAAGEKKGPQP